MLGAYDDAEICELVGIFMISLSSKKYSSNNIGLYRYYGLCQILETLVDNKQKNIKNNTKGFQRQRFTYTHKIQSES